MSKISIITTTYKHEKFIVQTIESVLAQSFTDWELLIWDDSPDDATWRIIQEYSQKYSDKIRAWHHAPNKGIIDNMNFLIWEISSKSEYVVFLEGDDILISTAIAEKLEIFDRYPDLWMVYNNFDFIDQYGSVFFRDFLQKAPYYIKNSIISVHEFLSHATWYGSYSTLMYRKAVLDRLKIKNPTVDRLYSVSDWDLFFRTVTQYPSYGINKSLTQYRRHLGNLSAQNMKIFDDLAIQMQVYLDEWVVQYGDFAYQMSLISLFRSVAFLEKSQVISALVQWRQSFSYNKTAYLTYKLWIWVLLLCPKIVRQYLLSHIIQRAQ
jgi:teichuronic acid biosynthesis glycosyltransferase TuaG